MEIWEKTSAWQQNEAPDNQLLQESDHLNSRRNHQSESSVAKRAFGQSFNHIQIKLDNTWSLCLCHLRFSCCIQFKSFLSEFDCPAFSPYQHPCHLNLAGSTGSAQLTSNFFGEKEMGFNQSKTNKKNREREREMGFY